MFKITEFLKRTNERRAIYLILHIINYASDSGCIIVDFDTKEEIDEFSISCMLNAFNFKNISIENIKEAIQRELELMIIDDKVDVCNLVSRIDKHSIEIPFSKEILIKSILDFKPVVDVDVAFDNYNPISRKDDCANILNNNTDEIYKIVTCTEAVLNTHTSRLNTELGLNFKNINIDLDVGGKHITDNHNRSYSGYVTGNYDLSDVKIVLHPIEMYYQELGENWFPFDVLALEAHLVSTLAHEFRHIWQIYNNFDFSDSKVDYLERREEQDARRFADDYVSRFFISDQSNKKDYNIEDEFKF